MAIDIRASVTCSLNQPILSGSLSDDYLQGSGLIKTRGSLEVSALITPDIGTAVTFSYVKDGVTHILPRKMRVLSSFADPFRRTTKIELGCKLTYLSDLKDPIDWTALSDPQNILYTIEDTAIVTLPIYASSVMSKCLSQLGIIASSIPLTNRFSIPEFDFSAGYVSVLSDLLVSENYFGYLDINEVLQVQSLDVTGGSGPVFTSADIVDLGPIGVGQLPGESVVVSYSSLVLLAPTEQEGGGVETPVTEEEIEEQEKLNWESTSTIGSPETYVISYTSQAEGSQTQTFTGTTSSQTNTQYETLKIKKTDIAESEGIDTQLIFIGSTATLSAQDQADFLTNPVGVLDANWPNAEPYEYVSHAASGDKWIYDGSTWNRQDVFPSEQDLYITKDVVISRTTEEYGPLISVASSIATDYLSNGYSFPGGDILLRKTVEIFEYDSIGNQLSTTVSKYEAAVAVAASVSVSWADPTGSLGFTTNLILTEKTVTTNKVVDDYTEETTATSIKYAFTQTGQQAVAKAVEGAATLADMSNIIGNVLASGLVGNGTTVTTSRRGVTMSQERPPAAIRTNLKYSDSSSSSTADPNNGFRTESNTNTVLALGSASAQRRTEFTLPYAPDDAFVGPSGGPFYRGNSDADIKAMAYGRVQNRLLLGNRSGINLQLSPERLPAAPFEPLYVQASGLTALYRANGTSWAFDSNGIVASVDALFWGAVGGTGTFWFPVAPGITTLPPEPPIVDGEMNANSIVLPYNETAIYDSRIRIPHTVTKFEYSLTLLTVVPASTVRVPADVRRVLLVNVPTAVDIATAALAPIVSIGAAVAPPVTAIAVAATAPSVSGGVSVTPPVIDIGIAVLTPVIQVIATEIFIPSVDVTVAATAPEIRTGASATMPVLNVAVAALAPTDVGSVADPNFANVSVLLHMDGANNSTTFTDSSSNNLAVGNTSNFVSITTAQSKFGGASANFSGTGSLNVPSGTTSATLAMGTGDFTAECWVRVASHNATLRKIFQMNDGSERAGIFLGTTNVFTVRMGSTQITGTTVPAVDTWHHIAVTRDTTVHKLWVNGVQEGGTWTNGYNQTNSRIDIGETGFTGWIDDLRVTKGVVRYTATFTPPTKAFPNQ